MDVNQYKAMKEKEMEYAVAKVESIKNSQDKFVRYKDVRPITDIKHMVETSVELYGDNIAFKVKDKPGAVYRGITYKETKIDMDALGTKLIALGLKDKNIAIIGDNRYEWAVSYLAVVCGTGLVVPLDKELAASEIQQLIKEADVECIIYSNKFEKIFKEIKASGDTKLNILINMDAEESTEDVFSYKKIVEEGKLLVNNGTRDFLDAQIYRDKMGILLFTSGTTGIAKGVMLSHGNIVEDLMVMVTLVSIRETDTFFSVLPIHHTYECTCGFLCPFFRGAAVAYCEGLKYIVKNLSEAKPTIFLGVPLILESLYKKIWQNAKKKGKDKALKKIIAINRKTKKIGIDLAPIFLKEIVHLFGGKMRLMICGGAAIDPAILEGIEDFGMIALQGYGLTECAPICALNPDIDGKKDAAGYMPPGCHVRINEADSEGIGEICVQGPNIMLGYYKNQAATDEVLKDGWFYTGDLGYIDEDGFVQITGRKKKVIITKNGKNVFPEELEYYLGKISYISESMVWGRDNDETGETLICASIRVDEEEVQEALGKDYTDADVAALIWKEIDVSINSEQPFFKRIKKIDIRKEEFEKTTGKKIKRFVDANKGIK